MTTLYVHLPFCARKCPYCSFVVAIGQGYHIERYVQGLLTEAAAYRGQPVTALYVGGGTPSLLNESQISAMLSGIKGIFDCRTVEEFTFEINPESFAARKAALLRECGVTRLSLGVQSFRDKYLKLLGRCHDAAQAEEAVRLAREFGFKNISMDLMYGMPGQSWADIEDDLKKAMAFQVEHVSLYCLNIEERSRFFVDKLKLPSDDEAAELYERVRLFLERHGYPQYEVSNFARPGFASHHNQHYWQGGDYVGLGVGAHSHSGGKRWWNVDRLPEYLKRVAAGVSPSAGEEQLTPTRRLSETFLIGLRMNVGVDLPALQERFGCVLSSATKERMDGFIQEGWLEEVGGRIRATARGRLVLDELAARLVE